LRLSKSTIHIFDIAPVLFIVIHFGASSVIKLLRFSQTVTLIDILVSNSFISFNLFASLASAAKPWKAMKEIVQRIAKIMITTISSMRVKA
jgi:hypothetical protein